jgi:hypothetical protein
MKINEFNIFHAVLVFALYLFSALCTAYILKISVAETLAKRRKRKRDQRIIQQAKAAKVWDKPAVLGGRALELKAWKDYKIKREPGETDACLRRKYADATKQRTATLEG